jgi:hypothetical protein
MPSIEDGRTQSSKVIIVSGGPDKQELFETMSESFHSQMSEMPAQDKIVSYSNRFIGFLDILGFKEILKDAAKSSPNDLFHSIVDSYWFFSASAALDFQIMSDSVIISSRDEHPASFISIANATNNLRNSFLERGILLRGAISFGPHFQSHGICISPALVEAYEVETQLAKDPRIVCSRSALDRVLPTLSVGKSGRTGIVGPYGFHVTRDQMPVADVDGVMIVEFLPDTLEAYFLRTGHHHDPSYKFNQEQISHCSIAGRGLLTRWKLGLTKAQARCKNAEHKQKVDYLVTKWNRYIRSFKKLSDSEKETYVL